MWNDEKTIKAIQKNILTSILLLLIVFLANNCTYLFHYLPHKSAYELREAYIQPSTSRRVRVVVMEQGKAVAKAKVELAYGEIVGDRIIVGYAPERKRSVVRCSPVISGGQILVLFALVLGNLRFLWSLHKTSL